MFSFFTQGAGAREGLIMASTESLLGRIFAAEIERFCGLKEACAYLGLREFGLCHVC